MKSIIFVILIIIVLLFLTGPNEEIDENHTQTTKTYIDTPVNTYQDRIEAQNIANTLQTPSSSYINSRIDSRDDAKKSVQEANQQMEANDKAIEAFMK